MAVTLVEPGVHIGADPEVFLTRPGRGIKPIIVGSETLFKRPLNDYYFKAKVVNDGVQAELHPESSHCREVISDNIAASIVLLHRTAEKNGLKVDFSRMVTISSKELAKLSDHAKFLGCKPSFNIYGRLQKEVNGLEYRKRSGSGHIHFGSGYIDNGLAVTRHAKRVIKAERLVSASDILVGIPGVLLDRDMVAVERRKLYGRAGEYRLPKHGLEYRTLSNFWLISYPVTSFVFAQAKLAFAAAFTETPNARRFVPSYVDLGTDVLNELIARADMKRVEKAINKNDVDLAYKIYDEAIKPVLKQTTASIGLGPMTPAGNKIYTTFEHFIQKPLVEWFPKDPVEHWKEYIDRYDMNGWESFIWDVSNKRRKE